MLPDLSKLGLVSFADVAASPSAAPKAPGLYAWWFAVGVLDVPIFGAITRDEMFLGYVGIAPRAPSAAGRVSKSTLRSRLRQHCRGPLARSTLRRSLAALLQRDLRLECKRNASGKLFLTDDGEPRLSAWLAQHARVNWIAHPAPWTLETALLQSGVLLPLNIQGHSSANQLLVARRKALG